MYVLGVSGRVWSRIPVAFASVVAGCLRGAPAFACPNCFGASSEDVRLTYYLSAAVLSILPFLVVAAISGISILYIRRRRGESNVNPEFGD